MSTVIFGKLPTEGDYIRLGDDSSLLAFLDGWITSTWAEFVLGADSAWEDRYRVSPLWWFTAPFEGMFVCGVISPSLDSVGRLFPLIVATRHVANEAAQAMQQASGWLMEVQEAIIQALEPPGLAAARLLEQVRAIGTAAPAASGLRRRTGMFGTQACVSVEDAQGWISTTAPPTAVGGPHWSLWQDASREGRSSRAICLDGWPGSIAIGELLASNPALAIDQGRGLGASLVEPASFRLEIGDEVPSFNPDSAPDSWRRAPAQPLVIRGIRGIAVANIPQDTGLASPSLPIIIRDFLGVSARNISQFHAAAEQLARLLDSAIIICKLERSWALARFGQALRVQVGASEAHSTAEAAPASLELRTWETRAPDAFVVEVPDEGGTDKPVRSALLGLRRSSTPKARRIVTLEPG